MKFQMKTYLQMISLYVIFQILELDSHSSTAAPGRSPHDKNCDVACRRCAQVGQVTHVHSIVADVTGFSHCHQCPYHTYVQSVSTVKLIVAIHEKVCEVEAF
jgi:hypothetical protein